MTQVKTGTEIIAEVYNFPDGVLNTRGEKLAAMIDANTALAVEEATNKAKDIPMKYKRMEFNAQLQEELELCKAHNLMLFNALKSGSLHGREVKALNATKETIEAYRNELVQKAKNEQRESDVVLCESERVKNYTPSGIALVIRNAEIGE